MIKAGMITISILGAVLTAPLTAPLREAQDLSRSWGFQFGMDLPAAARRANKRPVRH